MCEPFSIGAIFASVGSAFKFADLAVRVAEVGSENEVFVRTIRVVRDDLNEVERLLNNESVHRKVTCIPGKLPWIKSAIINTKSALNEIGKWVEHARAEQESTGSIRFETRIRWVFNDHEKLINRKTELSTCHQQLSNVLSYLLRLEDIPTTAEPPEYIDTTFFDDVLSRHKRRTTFSTPDGSSQLEQSFSIATSTASVSKKAAGVQRRPLPPPSPVEAARIHNIKHLKAETWSDEPPCSPPPTYTSVVTQNVSSEASRTSAADFGDFKTRGFAPSGDQNSRVPILGVFEKGRATGGTWAYEYSFDTATLPELESNHVSMSGTNSLGPVNPFDFAPERCIEVNMRASQNNEPGELVEMLGSLNFAVELPADDPGPPPGYPSRAKEVKVADMARKQPATTYAQYHQASAIELPTTAIRRPITTHANTDPGHIPRLQVSVGHDLSNTHLPQTLSTTAPLRGETRHFELPSTSCEPLGMLPMHRGQRNVHGNASPDIAPIQLLCHSSAAISSQSFQGMTTTGSGTHSNNDETRTSKQDTQAQSQGLIATGRMRRQKDMMDLLGSLE